MKYKEFIAEQVDRLDAVPGFQMSDAGRLEVADWIMKESGGAGTRATVSEWLREYEPARMIKAVIDEAVEWTTPPGLADLKTVWRRMYPPVNEQRANCQRCDGTGWIVVEGPYGTSAAYPCSHKPRTEAEARLGVPMSPAVARQYQRERESLPERVEAFNAHADKHPKEFRRTTVPQKVLDSIGGKR